MPELYDAIGVKNNEGVTHFLTQRFDRNGNEKIHTQTTAAMSQQAIAMRIFLQNPAAKSAIRDSKQQYLANGYLT